MTTAKTQSDAKSGHPDHKRNHTMANVNKTITIGRFVRDPDIRFTPKGTVVANFELAINRQFLSGNGDKQEETTFVGFTAWNNTAELIEKYCRKGDELYVEGRLTNESWDDKETGKKRTKTKIIVESIQFIGKRRDDSGEKRGQERRRLEPTGRTSGVDDAADDEIPF